MATYNVKLEQKTEKGTEVQYLYVSASDDAKGYLKARLRAEDKANKGGKGWKGVEVRCVG